MKAKIRHILNPPPPTDDTSKSLLGRILNSNAPIHQDSNHDEASSSGSLNNNMDAKSNISSTMNPSKSSSSVGLKSNDINTKSQPALSSSSSSLFTNNNDSIHLLEVHPTLPIICYLDFNGSTTTFNNNNNNAYHKNSSNNNTSTNKKSSKQQSGTYSTSSSSSSSVANILRQRIIVQNYITNTILQIISIQDIAQAWLEEHSSSKNIIMNQQHLNSHHNNELNKTLQHHDSSSMIQKICNEDLSFVTSLQFLDLDVYHHLSARSLSPYYNSFHQEQYQMNQQHDSHHHGHGHVHGHDETYTSTTPQPRDRKKNIFQNNVSSSSQSIIIQFKNIILIWPSSSQLAMSKVIFITSRDLHTTVSTTSKPLPVSYSTNIINNCVDTILAIGCADGVVRFYSTHHHKVIKSFRASSNSKVPIVSLVSVNTWYSKSPSSMNHLSEDGNSINNTSSNNNNYQQQYSSTSSITTTTTTSTTATTANSSMSSYTHHYSNVSKKFRLITISSSGSAYLWVLEVKNHHHLDDENDISTDSIITSISPILKLDGPGSSSGSATYPYSSSNNMNNGNSSIQQHKVEFDPHRQLLFWTLRNTKSHVVIWDLDPSKLQHVLQSLKNNSTSNLNTHASSSGNLHSSEQNNTPTKVPNYPPSLVVQIPFNDVTSLNSSSANSGTVVGNVTSITNMSNESNYSGDNLFFDDMIVGRLHPSFPPGALLCMVGSKTGDLAVMAAPLSDEKRYRKDNSSLPTVKACMYYNFNLWEEKLLRMLKINESVKFRLLGIIAPLLRPYILLMVTNVGIAVVDLRDNDAIITGSSHVCYTSRLPGLVGAGNGLVMIKNSAVYTGTLDFTPTSDVPNPIGPIACKDLTLVYNSPLPIDNSSKDVQERSYRLPPRLLSSPSGRFLCLFWFQENRYEILHVGSMLSSSRKSASEPEHYPAVDVGTNVLSFAWVGDEDLFAILHPPELKKVSKDGKEKKSVRKSISVNDENKDEDTAVRIDPEKYKPSVELRVLVGVNADAAEISGSIAAATATTLGNISLRGRHKPTCLFGGPLLCVGSLSIDSETSEIDGMAYFYCRNQNAAEGDNRASSYVSIGSPLPYPDIVVWDDEGRICAIVVGRRVALYIADPPKFALLGTILLGTPKEPDAKIESAKFVHGVLYCSTESSIQCIFLGDLEHDDTVCELDSYIISSSTTYLNSIHVQSLEPSSFLMPCPKPSILTYFNGSLLVSTMVGAHAIPLNQPLLRIGALIGSGHLTRAQKWFEAVYEADHEALACFLDRRGCPDMALQLNGLSLGTIIDLSFRHGYTERLENIIKAHGLDAIRSLDSDKMKDEREYSMVVCVGAHFLANNRVDIVKQMASDCLKCKDKRKRDAFLLAGLISAIQPEPGRKLIREALSDRNFDFFSWPVGFAVNDNS